jgi:hypothetical protein
MHVSTIERELRHNLHDMIGASPKPLIMANIGVKFGSEAIEKYGVGGLETIISTVIKWWQSLYPNPLDHQRTILCEAYVDLGTVIQSLLRVEAIEIAKKTGGS